MLKYIIQNSGGLLVIAPLFLSIFAAFMHKKLFVKKYFPLIALIPFLTIWAALKNLHNAGNSVYTLGSWPQDMGISMIGNYQSIFMIIIITIGLTISSFGLSKSKSITTNALTFVLLSYTGLCGICITGDIFNVYVFMELISLSSVILLTFDRKNKINYKNAFDYLIMGSLVGMIVLLGLVLLYAATGTLSMIELYKIIASDTLNPNQIILLKVSYILISLGMLLKAGLYPMHYLSVKIYTTGQVSSISYLASTASKAFLFALYKLTIIFKSSPQMTDLINKMSIVAISSAFLGTISLSLNNIGELNIRREIAASSMIQVCYFTICIFNFTDTSVMALFIQMLGHTISISLLLIYMETDMYSNKQELNNIHPVAIPKYLISRNKFSVAIVALNMLNIIGYPITLGFLSKWLFINNINKAYNYAVLIVASIANGASMIYGWRVIEKIFIFAEQHELDKKPQNSLKPKKSIIALGFIFLVSIFLISFHVANNEFVEFIRMQLNKVLSKRKIFELQKNCIKKAHYVEYSELKVVI